jgi:hypothetical protein
MSTQSEMLNNKEISVYTSKIEADLKQFELMQRKATLMANSTLVPVQYRLQNEIKEFGKVTGYTENKNAISNCAIAIDMAQRMNANELMVMQNLSIIEGRPSWSSQWIIASINDCGKYSSLRFDYVDLGEKEVEYIEYKWAKGERTSSIKKIKIHDFSCVAYATEKSTGVRLDSAKISIEMAVKEGWYTKVGSKWQTMHEVMLRYRAAAFFGKIYAPELLMGLQSVEENQDVVELKYKNVINVESVKQEEPKKFNPEIIEKPIFNITNDEADFEIPADIIAKAEKLNLDVIEKEEVTNDRT